MEIEKEIEYEFATRNEEVFELYKHAIKSQKKIIIISDMYFDKDFISLILRKCGYVSYDKLYVSSDMGLRKKNGDLYKFVLNEMKCNPKMILHFGDNKRSDIWMARINDIKTVYVKKRDKILYHYNKSDFNKNLIQNNVFLSFVYNNSICQMDDLEYIGYSILGFPVFGFCNWVHEETKGIHKFFLARDGYLIKEIYLDLFPDEIDYVHYLYISRKALRRPNLYNNIDFESFVEQLPNVKEYRVEDILNFCFVDEPSERSTLLQKYSMLPAMPNRNSLAENYGFKQLFEDIKYLKRDDYKIQYNNLKQYLKQENFTGNVAVIDVGWRATAQINLSSICKEEVDITGYYFGVEESVTSRGYNSDKIRGFFWNFGQKNNISCCILNGRKGIFESMFLSSEGSTSSYEKNKNGKIVPKVEATDIIYNPASVIQNGAKNFVKDFKKLSKYIPSFIKEDYYKGILDYMLYPNKNDLAIGDIICENYRVAYLAKPNTKFFYLTHPSNIVSDFKFAEWKVGFVARLFNCRRIIEKFLNYLYEAYRHK